MQNIYTRYARLNDLPLETPADWLSPREAVIWHAIRSPARRRSWLAGRIVLKELLRDVSSALATDSGRLEPMSVEIISRAAAAGLGERPVAVDHNGRLPCSLSLAHSDRGVLAAVACRTDCWTGVDLVESPSGDGLDWVFTESERQWIRRAPNLPLAAARLWGLKEAIYKACQRGEGFAPAAIDVTPGQILQYHGIDMQRHLVALQSWTIDRQIAVLAVIRSELKHAITNSLPLPNSHAA